MRAIWARIKPNVAQLQSLAGPLRTRSRTLTWGKRASGEFNSAVEDGYPVELCESIIAVFKEVLDSRATKFPNIVYAQKNDGWHAP